jgi:hypothetical protein
MHLPAAPALLMFFGSSGPAKIPISMLIVFVSAKLMAELAERIGQPGIVGEILAGVLIGPSVFGWLAPNEFLSALSDLGAMFLLFRVGLEVKSSELLKVGGTATLVAFSGVVVPMILGRAHERSHFRGRIDGRHERGYYRSGALRQGVAPRHFQQNYSGRGRDR